MIKEIDIEYRLQPFFDSGWTILKQEKKIDKEQMIATICVILQSDVSENEHYFDVMGEAFSMNKFMHQSLEQNVTLKLSDIFYKELKKRWVMSIHFVINLLSVEDRLSLKEFQSIPKKEKKEVNTQLIRSLKYHPDDDDEIIW